jgi:hypothetical protein
MVVIPAPVLVLAAQVLLVITIHLHMDTPPVVV